MSGPGGSPALYSVTYSAAVRQRLKLLAGTARARGDGEEFIAALREFDRRLQVYPQFGDPLLDLVAEVGQIRLGAVPPLAMRYGVVEDRRLVLVASPPVLLPMRPLK
ncbi:hypothetical protein BH10PLA2_BH10PLA2_40280 [soil metagenome]